MAYFLFPLFNTKSIAGIDNYPDIIICPFPSFDQIAIRKFGYKNLFEYSSGEMWETSAKVDGWAGHGNYSTEIIREATKKNSSKFHIIFEIRARVGTVTKDVTRTTM